MDPALNHQPPDDVESLLRCLQPKAAHQAASLETFYQAGYAAGRKAAEAAQPAAGRSARSGAQWFGPASFSSGAVLGIAATVLLMMWWIPDRYSDSNPKIAHLPTVAEPGEPQTAEPRQPVQLEASEPPTVAPPAEAHANDAIALAASSSQRPLAPAPSLLEMLGRLLVAAPDQALPRRSQTDWLSAEPRYSLVGGGVESPLRVTAVNRRRETIKAGPRSTGPPDPGSATMLHVRSQVTEFEL